MQRASVIFEAAPIPGGMLTLGIPEYRLPKEILKKEVTQQIIIMSAHNDYLFDSIEDSLSGILSKPIDLTELLNLIFKTSKTIHEHKSVK